MCWRGCSVEAAFGPGLMVRDVLQNQGPWCQWDDGILERHKSRDSASPVKVWVGVITTTHNKTARKSKPETSGIQSSAVSRGERCEWPMRTPLTCVIKSNQEEVSRRSITMGKCHNFTSNFQAWGEFQGLDLREVCYFKRRPPTMSSLLPSPGPGVLTPSSKETWCPHSIPKMVLETFIRVTLIMGTSRCFESCRAWWVWADINTIRYKILSLSFCLESGSFLEVKSYMDF